MDITKESLLLIKKLAQNIEKWKKGNDISQRELGRRSNVAESTLRAIKKGASNIEIATLVKLKLAFSVDVPHLFQEKEKIPVIISNPLSSITIKNAIANEQVKIGKNISSAMKGKNMKPEDLSIIAFDTDYSDTIKYLKGQINLTMITVLKFTYALEVGIWKLLD